MHTALRRKFSERRCNRNLLSREPDSVCAAVSAEMVGSSFAVHGNSRASDMAQRKDSNERLGLGG